MTIPPVKFTDKQVEAFDLIKSDKTFIKFYGSSRSGKTFLIVRTIIVRCLLYPGSAHLIARYSFANAKKNIWLQTILPQVLPLEKAGLCRVSHSTGLILFENMSTIQLGGLEPHRIDSVLGSEYATIFLNEANENSFKIFETLQTRLNSTAKRVETGKKIPLKFFIDLNPTITRSWTYSVFMQGRRPDNTPIQNFNEFGSLKFRSEDNKENLSENYINTLKNLSASQRKRFYEGEYGTADGLIFDEFNPEFHIVDDIDIPKNWSKFIGIDFGYIHPTAAVWVALDSANEVLYVYREYRVGGLTSQQQAREIKKYLTEAPYTIVSDHQSEYRAGFQAEGIQTIPADKNVQTGIDRMKELLSHNKIKIFRSCTKLIDEIYSYVYKQNSDKLEPVKEEDDLIDALRYAVMVAEPPRTAKVIYGVNLT